MFLYHGLHNIQSTVASPSLINLHSLTVCSIPRIRPAPGCLLVLIIIILYVTVAVIETERLFRFDPIVKIAKALPFHCKFSIQRIKLKLES